jgi:hypothetical protein
MVMDYKTKTTRQKYAKDEAYIAFKSNIWVSGFSHRRSTFKLRKLKFLVQESTHHGAPMPPITEQIPRGKHILHHQQKFDDSERIFHLLQKKGTTATKMMI